MADDRTSLDPLFQVLYVSSSQPWRMQFDETVKTQFGPPSPLDGKFLFVGLKSLTSAAAHVGMLPTEASTAVAVITDVEDPRSQDPLFQERPDLKVEYVTLEDMTRRLTDLLPSFLA